MDYSIDVYDDLTTTDLPAPPIVGAVDFSIDVYETIGVSDVLSDRGLYPLTTEQRVKVLLSSLLKREPSDDEVTNAVIDFNTTGLIGGFDIGDDYLSITDYSLGNMTRISSGATAFQTGPVNSPTAIITKAGRATFTNVNITGRVLTIDNTQDIQTAIDDLGTDGGTVHLKSGTYSITDDITIDATITLEGDAMSNTILDFGALGKGIKVQSASSVYTTGKVTPTTPGATPPITAITGTTGADWSAYVGVSGLQLFIQNKWYVIASVDSSTTLTLSEPIVDVLSYPANYKIGYPVENVKIRDLTVQNAGAANAITAINARNIDLKDVTAQTSLVGISITDSFIVSTKKVFSYVNASDCFQFVNSAYASFEDMIAFGSVAGNGYTFNNVRTMPIYSSTALLNFGDGIQITDSTNMYMELELVGNGGNGAECVSGNTNLLFRQCSISSNTGDGIKFTTSINSGGVIGSSIEDNTGYGINIAASGDNDLIISSNVLSGNNSSGIQGIDSGTRTVIRGNIGWADQNRGEFISVEPGDDIQAALTNLATEKGTLEMAAGTYSVSSDLVVPAGVSVIGKGAGTTIVDFGGGAYSFKFEGSNGYTTGTVSATNGSPIITGLGTSWLGLTGGQIYIGNTYYDIDHIDSNTQLEITQNFDQPDMSGEPYAIADVADTVFFEDISITNTTAAGIKLQYASNVNINNCYIYGCGNGIDADWVTALTFHDGISNSNTSAGMDLHGVSSFSFFTSGFNYNGTTGISFHNCEDGTVFDSSTIFNSAGITAQDCTDIVMTSMSIDDNTNIGFEGISIDASCKVSATSIARNGSDGVKLTATTDYASITTCTIHDNGGYGINVAASTCDNTIITGNEFASNSSGACTDSGTGTVIRGNTGLADNGTGAYAPVPTGSISAFAGSSAPSGWLICDGSTVSQSTYAALYAITGHTYGADPGGGNFILPDLRRRVPVGYKSSDSDFGTLGGTGGVASVTLTSAQSGLPAHTHDIVEDTLASTNSNWNVFDNTTNDTNGTPTSTPAGLHAAANAAADASSAHTNLQPYITINYIIKT